MRLSLGPSQVALMVKNLPANTRDIRDMGSIPGSGRSPGGGYGNLCQYSCLENPMDRTHWQETVQRVSKKSDRTKATSHTHTHTLYLLAWWPLISLVTSNVLGTEISNLPPPTCSQTRCGHEKTFGRTHSQALLMSQTPPAFRNTSWPTLFVFISWIYQKAQH